MCLQLSYNTTLTETKKKGSLYQLVYVQQIKIIKQNILFSVLSISVKIRIDINIMKIIIIINYYINYYIITLL